MDRYAECREGQVLHIPVSHYLSHHLDQTAVPPLAERDCSRVKENKFILASQHVFSTLSVLKNVFDFVNTVDSKYVLGP